LLAVVSMLMLPKPLLPLLLLLLLLLVPGKAVC
jgi:hypothetical protein